MTTPNSNLSDDDKSGFYSANSSTPTASSTIDSGLSETPSSSTTTQGSLISKGTNGTSDVYLPNSSRITQRTGSLEIEQMTINTLQFASLGLYGRDKETKILENTLLQTINNSNKKKDDSSNKEEKTIDNNNNDEKHHRQRQRQRHPNLVFVAGASGTGKSELVRQALQNPTIKSNGFYVSGKFDQQQQCEPYSGIASACNDLCSQIESLDERRPRIITTTTTTTTTTSFSSENDIDTNTNDNNNNMTFEQIQSKLIRDLGSEKTLLTKMIPGLKRIFGFQNDYGSTNEGEDDEEEVSLSDAWSRFNYAFRRLMRSVSSFGPLVLVLDDLQWCDAASIDLLESLFLDMQNNNTSLLIICLYRSNEVDDAHLLSKLIRDLKSRCSNNNDDDHDDDHNNNDNNNQEEQEGDGGLGKCLERGALSRRRLMQDTRRGSSTDFNVEPICMREINIGSLELDPVNEMLADLLRREKHETETLANVIYNKTHGNVFYVIRLLETLENDGYLKFNFGSFQWTWDVDEIKINTQYALNVVDLVRKKLKTKFTVDMFMKLPIAACLGATFDIGVFQLVSHAMDDEELSSFFDAAEVNKSSSSSSSLLITKTTAVTVDDEEEENNITVSADSSRNNSIEKTNDDNSKFISFCVEHGVLISKNDTSQYRWTHDKVQEAAFGLVKDGQIDNFASRIGTILQSQFHIKSNLLHDHLFVVVNLLNRGITVPTQKPNNNELNIEIIKMNLQAGKKSLGISAFASASHYMKAAIRLLPDNHWYGQHYELSLQIYETYSGAEYAMGNYDNMTGLCNTIIEQNHLQLEDKFYFYRLICEGLILSGKYEEATAECLSALELIGIRFPKNEVIIVVSIILNIVQVKKVMKTTTEDTIRNLQQCEDKTQKFAYCLMETLLSSAIMTGSKIAALAILRQFKRTFKHGYFIQSSGNFGGVALVLTAILNELKLGKKSVEFGRIVQDHTKSKRYETRYICSSYGMTLHILESLSVCMKQCLTGYQVGLQMGDMVYGLWNIFWYLQMGYRCGKYLEDIEADCAIYSKQMVEANAFPPHSCTVVFWQFIHNLMGYNDTDNIMDLSGGVIQQDEYLKVQKSVNNKAGLYLVSNRQLVLGSLFGKHTEAADIAVEMGEIFYQDSPGFPSWPDQFTFGAVSCVSAYRITKNGKYLRYAKAQAKKIKGWTKEGSPNFLHWTLLIDAELTSLRGKKKKKKAKESFEKAACVAARMGRRHEFAFIHERFAEFLLRASTQNGNDDAAYHLKEACKLFDEWGAASKVEHLRNKCMRIF